MTRFSAEGEYENPEIDARLNRILRKGEGECIVNVRGTISRLGCGGFRKGKGRTSPCINKQGRRTGGKME